MGLINASIKIAIGLAILNFLMGGFVFQQMEKADYSGLSDPVVCGAGIYISVPMHWGLPINFGVDDFMIALIGGFFILGFFSSINKPLTGKKKILAFILAVVVYKIIGMLMMYSVPGCVDYAETVSEILSPVSLIIFGLGTIFIVKY